MMQLNPVGHGQALTAQILAANAQPSMGPIRTVAQPQLQSRAFNSMDEVQKELAFNRDFYSQKDAQGAATALEGQRQGNALALEGLRNENALERQKLSDKNALDRLELADEKAIALEGLRNTNNLDLRKAVEKWEADERELNQTFQIEREKIASKEKGDAAKLLQTQLEDRYKREQAALDARLDKMLEKQKAENDRVYNRDVEREDELYNRGKTDKEDEYKKNLKNDKGRAAQARNYTKQYEEWTNGKNQAYLADEQRAALLSLPRREVFDDDGEVVENPTDNEYLRYVEFTPEEQSRATREARAKYEFMDRRIRDNYREIPRMGITGDYMDPRLYGGNALAPGAPPPSGNRGSILDDINNRNKRAEEIKAQLAQP